MALAFACPASAQQKEIKIGFIYDVTGPFAGGGSEPAQLGTKRRSTCSTRRAASRLQDQRCVRRRAVEVDVAINEMTRLIDQEKVDSSWCVLERAMRAHGAADRCPQEVLWVNVCIATAVFKDRQLSYVFRPQAHSDQFGAASCDYIDHYAQSKFGIAPKNMRIAILYEDGPYGAASRGQRRAMQEARHERRAQEGYSATAPDLSSLVTKLKRSRPDVLLHTGYNPDITLFLRQRRSRA